MSSSDLGGDKGRGLMSGLAVGDCLGRPVEGHRHVPESYLRSVVDDPPTLVYTDDTAMAISLAESLLACDGFDGADMARRFAEGFRDDPFRGYGGNVVDVFESVLAGVGWKEAASRQFDGAGSFGNGAAMRVAPVALFASGLSQVVELAESTAKVTHTHPVGVEGAVIQAVAVWYALRSDPSRLDREPLLAELDRLARTDDFRAKLDLLPSVLEEGDDEVARVHLGNWVSAANSVVTALYCFLAASSFEETILRALRIGGDVDTIAAMAGAQAGARFGLSGIPVSWRAVEGNDRLLRLADRLQAT